jgi:serine/threonine-protein kinase
MPCEIMALSIGTQLGSHEITALLGKGGMGEVYRARDLKLKREVAIKILPAEFSRDTDRINRFQREAEVLASLNHSNIAGIYDLAEANGSRYLVLELVEGETLADRIARGPIPVDEALAIAKQICEALEAAHERGIVHRDLKPANVKLTPDGRVKVLDFGLAKAMEDRASTTMLSNSPTILSAATNAGVILGTASYMSPEQAAGRAADRRADIWSFGVVLWEMLTGKRLFEAESISHTLADVLRSEIPFSQIAAPEQIKALLRRCLDRDLKNRLQWIGEARVAIANYLANPTSAIIDVRGKFRSSTLAWAATSLLAIVAGLSLWVAFERRPTARQPAIVRFAMTLPARPNPGWVALSHDGEYLAFSAGSLGKPIYVRKLDQLELRPLTGTEDALFPAFSPDNQWIAYMSVAGGRSRHLKKIPLMGGLVQTLVENIDAGPSALRWEADDNIYYGTRRGLERVSGGGGKPEVLAQAQKGEVAYNAPQLLPGGTMVLFSASLGLNRVQIRVLNLRTGEQKVLLEDAGFGAYAPVGPGAASGQIIYGRNGSLFAARFDKETVRAGPPLPLLSGIEGANIYTTFGFSDSGTLAYVPATGQPIFADLGVGGTLAWVDRQGTEEPLPAPARNYWGDPRLSPDGARTAIAIIDPQQGITDIWIYELARGALTRFTSDKVNLYPAWTPDGKRLVYASSTSFANQENSELRTAAADSSSLPTTLASSDGSGLLPTSLSPDGKLVIGVRDRPGTSIVNPGGRRIFILPLDPSSASGAKTQVFLESAFDKGRPTFSPDGRWVAFQSNDTGMDEIYVVPYPGPGGKTQVSTGGGTSPRWSRSGELFYKNGDKMMAVKVETGAEFRPGAPRMLFEKAGAYDVTPDGKRFLMVRPASGKPNQTTEMHVVVNWFTELQQRAPVK